jgi:site-specific DNA recombinase
VCFSRHRYGTSECPQDRLRAEELEERVVENLLTTLERRDLLEEALRRWTDQMSEGRPKRERELAAVDARIRKAEAALDRYFRAFEDGRLSEDVCADRIREVAAKVGQLKASRSELEDEISADESYLVSSEDLGELREEIQLALRSGPLPERKALMQTLVEEIRVRDRNWIQPVFRVPVFRPPYGSVLPTGQKSKKCPQVEGHMVRLSARHAKIRREGVLDNGGG